MLSVLSENKKKIICNKVVFRTSFFAKATGLMFHKMIFDEAHIFIFNENKKVALTMWWVFFPIDVLYLDKNKKIVEIKENFKPFTNYYPVKESMFVIELPVGTIKEKKLKIDDKLSF
jgi:uncharacterized protein